MLGFFQPTEAGFACVAANSIRLGTLHKQSPPSWTNTMLGFFQPAEAGFACVAANSIRLGTFFKHPLR
jgi:hypothetical protein